MKRSLSLLATVLLDRGAQRVAAFQHLRIRDQRVEHRPVHPLFGAVPHLVPVIAREFQLRPRRQLGQPQRQRRKLEMQRRVQLPLLIRRLRRQAVPQAQQGR